MSYLEIPRGQLDRMLELGRVEGNALMIPNRHMDAGWSDYRVLRPESPIQMWYISQAAEDRARLERFPERETDWARVAPGRGKGDDIHIAAWYRYLEGANPEYPEQLLDVQWGEVARRMDRMAHDDGDPEAWDVHHWQEINPVHTEALVQLTCGGPQIVYHGGLLHTRLRYYDADARRPGLPADVAALVERLDADSVHVTLVNTSLLHPRRLIVQAGAFGEHCFTRVRDELGAEAATAVGGRCLELLLQPCGVARLNLEMERYVYQPSYDQPI
ncbi:MAG: hypothetical protein GX557_05380 [Chloroflexi bacterium]|nr:hypothetical protein [Chloroflexota bacterium]